MRLLADENISASVIGGLRASGHDVLSVKEVMRGASDVAILRSAQAEGRVLLTHDKDFGELIYRAGLPGHCGLILLRLSGACAQTDNARALAAVESRCDWAGHFSVVTDDLIRMRPVPTRTVAEDDV